MGQGSARRSLRVDVYDGGLIEDVIRLSELLQYLQKEYRSHKLAELYNIITGEGDGYGYNFPSSPIVARTIKGGSSLKPNKIILHPERQRLNQERSKKLAELSRFINGLP